MAAVVVVAADTTNLHIIYYIYSSELPRIISFKICTKGSNTKPGKIF